MKLVVLVTQGRPVQHESSPSVTSSDYNVFLCRYSNSCHVYFEHRVKMSFLAPRMQSFIYNEYKLLLFNKEIVLHPIEEHPLSVSLAAYLLKDSLVPCAFWFYFLFAACLFWFVQAGLTRIQRVGL